jgi:hypothetical protein
MVLKIDSLDEFLDTLAGVTFNQVVFEIAMKSSDPKPNSSEYSI